jgi:hypothetical protein
LRWDLTNFPPRLASNLNPISSELLGLQAWTTALRSSSNMFDQKNKYTYFRVGSISQPSHIVTTLVKWSDHMLF